MFPLIVNSCQYSQVFRHTGPVGQTHRSGFARYRDLTVWWNAKRNQQPTQWPLILQLPLHHTVLPPPLRADSEEIEKDGWPKTGRWIGFECSWPGRGNNVFWMPNISCISCFFFGLYNGSQLSPKLVTNISQNIFFWVQQKKVSHAGLELHEGK